MTERYAETCNYWKSSNASPDSVLEKTIGLVEKFGGEVLGSGYGNENMTGRAAYMVRFSVDGESFRVVWPVLPSETGNTLAARRQAASMMYHDIKAKCVASQVLGARTAFFTWLELPDGRAAFQLSSAELVEEVPRMLLAQKTAGLLESTDVV